MKSNFILLLFLGLSTHFAQENLSYQNPKSILDLVDYETAISKYGHKREYMLLTYRDSYKTLDDLNQDEMRLGGLRINPTTNISSTVTYIIHKASQDQR
jgi:hypothetical protein